MAEPQDPAHLEHGDSTVARAAASLARYYDSLAARGEVPRTRFRKSTPDKPCEVVR